MDAWAKESIEVQRNVADEQDKRHQAAIESWSKSGLRPLDLETQCRYIVFLCMMSLPKYSFYSALDSLQSTLGPVLKTLQSSTGYVFTVIAGGPNLSQPGDLSIIECVAHHLLRIHCSDSHLTQRYHEGSIGGDHPIDFGIFASEFFTRTVRPEFAKFLRKVFCVFSITHIISVDLY